MGQEVIVVQYLETVLTEYPRINALQNVERCAFVQASAGPEFCNDSLTW